METVNRTYQFEGFTLDATRRSLLVGDREIELRSKSFDVLCCLVEHAGSLVDKDTIIQAVWPGLNVTDESLTRCVSDIRASLDDRDQRIVKTIPRRGYLFAAVVSRVSTTAKRNPPAADMDALSLPPVPDRPSIAVLPFANISGDPDQEYFADGIAEDIITALTRFTSLFVVARNSSFVYKKQAIGVRQIGRELGVRYVLEGSVRKLADRVRLTGQLLQAENGMHIWAEHYDGDLRDIFALQDETTASVVGAVVPSIQQAEIERARARPPKSLDAYDLYLRALPKFYACTRESNEQALSLAEQALELDSNFIAAEILAENCWSLKVNQGWVPGPETQAKVMKHARRAVQIDKDNADALATLARRVSGIERNYEEAGTLAERAVALNPNSAVAWRQGGFAMLYAGRAEAALKFFERAVRLSPRDVRAEDSWAGMALALIQLERDQEAVAAARRAVQGYPNHATGWRALAASLALTGQLDEARTIIRRLLAIDPSCSVTGMTVRQTYTDKAKARYFDGLRKAGLPE